MLPGQAFLKAKTQPDRLCFLNRFSIGEILFGVFIKKKSKQIKGVSMKAYNLYEALHDRAGSQALLQYCLLQIHKPLVSLQKVNNYQIYF